MTSKHHDISDTITTYYSDLSRFNPIEKEEEYRLINEAKNGSISARNKVIEANVKFVFEIAKRYAGRGVSLSDLIQEGNLGMLKAIDKFDSTKECKFISYAVWWIRYYILESIRKHSLLCMTEIEPSCPNDLVMEQSLMDENDEKVFFNEIQFSDQDVNDRKETQEKQTQFTVSLLEALNNKERTVIERLFGLDGTREQTLMEVGDSLNMSCERVRQIKLTAIKKMRSKALVSSMSQEDLF